MLQALQTGGSELCKDFYNQSERLSPGLDLQSYALPARLFENLRYAKEGYSDRRIELPACKYILPLGHFFWDGSLEYWYCIDSR